MHKLIIFGNSGSGKSTLATGLSEAYALTHLDLDTIAWQPTMPPQRRPIPESWADIEAFLQQHQGWVIEGCYGDLLSLLLPFASQIIYLDLPVELCIANARNRPWEPHKYPSKQAQDANLAMLIDWIAQYSSREDSFSASAHGALFAAFDGPKLTLDKNADTALIISAALSPEFPPG